MSLYYDNDDFLDIVKDKSALPENQDTWSDQKILNLANEVIRDTLLPQILKLREEYYVFPESVSVTASTAAYRVNPRFTNAGYREVKLVDGANLVDLPPISPEDVVSTATGRPTAFYMRGNSLVLYPTPDASYTLSNTGFIRPSRLTEVANCCQIESIDPVLFQVTVDAIPSTWTAGTVIDFVKATPGYEILAIDYSIDNASGVTITFTSLPTGLQVGDYVAPYGQTPVPNIPEELFSVLAEFTVQKILKAAGFNEEASLAGSNAGELMQNVIDMMRPRIQGAPKKFKTRLL
jgi:hypothetical protein